LGKAYTYLSVRVGGMAVENFRPGDWMCPCGAHNYASKSACFKCALSKENATGTSYQPQRDYHHLGFGMGGGVGQMGHLNVGGMGHMGGMGHHHLPNLGGLDMATLASIAGMDVPSLQAMMSAYGLFPGPSHLTPPNFRIGDWMCTCGNHNYASRAVCAKCGIQKSLVVNGRGVVNHLPPTFRAGDWMCKCGNHNYQSRTACGKCREPKETADRTGYPSAVVPNFQVGDWMCTCGAHNYQSKTACYKCHLPKESAQVPNNIPAQVYASFRPGDWLCPSCNNHNYASRIVCGRCKVPKVSVSHSNNLSPLSQ